MSEITLPCSWGKPDDEVKWQARQDIDGFLLWGAERHSNSVHRAFRLHWRKYNQILVTENLGVYKGCWKLLKIWEYIKVAGRHPFPLRSVISIFKRQIITTSWPSMGCSVWDWDCDHGHLISVNFLKEKPTSRCWFQTTWPEDKKRWVCLALTWADCRKNQAVRNYVVLKLLHSSNFQTV